jgi:Tfp pilus assembly protein PilX
MNRLPKAVSSRERAAALIIVLAFVVLLTGLGVAYLSRATSDRQVAHNSFNQSNVDQLAQSAMDNIIGDLRQEILNGSGSPSPTASPVTLFVPTSNANMVQRRNNTASAIPNLIRRSIRSESSLWPDPVTGPALGSRASAVNSYADASSNARSISLARWNSHYLIPKSNTGDGGSNPITTGYSAPNYWAPDWVFVTSAGATPSPAPANVIGRYAYAIYDEGGLLDMNAAGYPSPTTILQYGRKGSLAFADLTGLGGFWFSATPLDNLIGWRNYASSQPSGTLSPPSSNLSFSANATNTYYNFILSDPSYIQITN